ncbi:hypothetical protein [Aquimarina algiphila]|nr:hypothetical protein [Aquimarina algiphila]
MKNLENYGVQELNYKDQNEIKGGGLIWLFIAGIHAGYWVESQKH